MVATTLLNGIPYLISLAAVLGTFYGIRYTNRVNIALQRDRIRSDERMKHQEILRSKGEQLYSAIQMFESAFRTNALDVAIALIQNEGNEKAVEVLDMRECNKSLLAIEMLAKVYFPSTVKALEDLEALWRVFGITSTKIVKSKDVKQLQSTANEIVAVSGKIAEGAENLQREVIKSLQHLHADLIGLSHGQAKGEY